MKTQTILLAGGESKRFKQGLDIPYPKQLAPLGDETVIGRLLRQTQERGQQPIVVTHDPVIASVSPQTFEPAKRRYCAETFLATQPLWADRTIVLWSDAVFSDQTMDAIYDCSDPLKMFARFREDLRDIMAVSFDHSQHGLLQTELEKAIAFFDGMPRYNTKNIMIWHVYRSLNGFGYLQKRFKDNDPLLHLIDDWSQDIDYYHEYLAFIDRNLL